MTQVVRGELRLSPHALLGLVNQLHRLLQQCGGVVHSPDIRRRVGTTKRLQGSAIESQLIRLSQCLSQFIVRQIPTTRFAPFITRGNFVEGITD